ncbi:lipocalin-like domain-containing protein [Rhodococcus koreensis]
MVRTWLLVDFTRIVDGEVVSRPLGHRPTGQLTYQADGRMSALLMRAKRPWHESHSFFQASDRDRAAAALGFTGYGGTYEVNGSIVTHHVQMSLYPDHVGTDLVRSISWVEDRLILRTTSQRTRSGRQFHDHIEWRPA